MALSIVFIAESDRPLLEHSILMLLSENHAIQAHGEMAEAGGQTTGARVTPSTVVANYVFTENFWKFYKLKKAFLNYIEEYEP